MEQKLYENVNKAGTVSLITGILTIFAGVMGITAGILTVVHAVRLLGSRKMITF